MNRPDPSILKSLETYKPYNDEEAVYVDQLRNFLHHGDNHYDRNNLVAHVVADAWILNASRDKVVLVEHGVNKCWMAPGGHCDGDSDAYSGALREAEEETGLVNLRPLSGNIFDVCVGIVAPCQKPLKFEPTHLHFDLCYIFEADEEKPLRISDESTQLEWIDINKIAEMNYMTCHLRRVEKTLNVTWI